MTLLTLKEISSNAMPLSTLTWARRRHTSAFKIGKKWVIKEEDLNNFLEKRRDSFPLSQQLDQPLLKGGQENSSTELSQNWCAIHL